VQAKPQALAVQRGSVPKRDYTLTFIFSELVENLMENPHSRLLDGERKMESVLGCYSLDERWIAASTYSLEFRPEDRPDFVFSKFEIILIPATGEIYFVIRSQN
jgi:hypothetical protein